MSRFDELLSSAPVLLEGAMGTMLMDAGLPAGEPGETITLENPAALADIHSQYVEAGSRVLTTNTFNANPIRLSRTKLADRLEEANRDAVRIAREQANGVCAVAGDIGPTGEMIAPLGSLSFEDAASAFAEQAKHLCAEGVDLLLIETMMDVQEAMAALEGCRRAGDVPIVASMAFMDTPNGFATMMGNAATDALPQLVEAGASAVGANCQIAGEAMVRLVDAVKAVVNVPLIAQPNAGQPAMRDGLTVYDESPETFAEHVSQLAQAGVSFIGGCCGTTPAHIRAARAAL